jgi:hypothetical protein
MIGSLNKRELRKVLGLVFYEFLILVIGKIMVSVGVDVFTFLWVIIKNHVSFIKEWSLQSITLTIRSTEFRRDIQNFVCHVGVP